MVDELIKLIKKEAYLLPMAVCLFLVPLFWNPFLGNPFTQGKEILMKSAVLATVMVCTAILFFRKQTRIRAFWKSPLFLLLTAGAVVVAASTAFSPTPLIAFFGTYGRGFGFFTQAYLFVFLVYCAVALKGNDVLRIVRFVFVVAAIAALYGLLQKAGIDPLFSGYNTNIFEGRIFSFLGNPGYLGQYLLLGILCGIYCFLEAKQRRSKIIFGITLLFMLAALWFAQTRTSVFALLICFILAGARYRKEIGAVLKKKSTRRNMLAGLGITAMIALFFLLPQSRFSFSEESLRSVNSRMEIWKGAVNLIQKHPWLGYGQETFSIYSPEIITKQFLTLEEDLNLSIDRIHNETLEVAFSYGVFAVLLYFFVFGYLVRKFFQTRSREVGLLTLLVITNFIQNQFSFSDISISLLMAFCLGGIVMHELNPFDMKKITSTPVPAGIIALCVLAAGYFAFENTIYRPLVSQLAYAESVRNYSVSYDVAVNEHKKATLFTPNYSELWFDLMFLDPSSMGRALENIERIEGKTGNLLAWKGNYYRESDPEKAGQYYLQALEKNPYYPNWIRTYADMLYKNGDYENALALYKIYLDAVPDFWKWKDSLSEHTQKEQKSYRIFFKNVPDFWKTVERVEELENGLKTTIQE